MTVKEMIKSISIFDTGDLLINFFGIIFVVGVFGMVIAAATVITNELIRGAQMFLGL